MESFDKNNDVERLEPVDFTSKDSYHLMRALRLDNRLSHTASDVNAAQKKVLDECPGIRMSMWDGYVAFFPLSDLPSIYEHIAWDVDAETPMHINQIAYFKEGARLALDFDATREMDKSEIKRFLEILRDTLRAYYTNFDQRPIPIFVSKCGPRMKKARSVVSVHMICHVCPRFKDALQLLFGFQQRCLAESKLEDSDVKMDGIHIDLDIYNEKKESVNLRMVYSSKVDPCQTCKSLSVFEQRSCRACDGLRKVRTRHQYIPAGHLCGETRDFAATHATSEMIVQNHSIWGKKEEMRSDFAVPDGEPLFDLAAYREARKKPRSEPKPKKRKLKSSVYQWLEDIIRMFTRDGKFVWANLCVKDIQVDGNFAMVHIEGLGSGYCYYANTDHGSRSFYFRLSSRGEMVMRCGSKNHDNCQTFHKSKDTKISFMLPEKLTNDIFGEDSMPDFRKVPQTKSKTWKQRELEKLEALKRANNF
jgi:hypothetical protein